ncbi:MAG: hypothetical protein ABFS45_07465 [Pseudomonadota bacterium]
MSERGQLLGISGLMGFDILNPHLFGKYLLFSQCLYNAHYAVVYNREVFQDHEYGPIATAVFDSWYTFDENPILGIFDVDR